MEWPIVRAESSCPAGRALFWIDFILGITNNVEEMFYMYQNGRKPGQENGQEVVAADVDLRAVINT